MNTMPDSNVPPESSAGSHYVDAGMARKAVELAVPMIERAREDRRIVGSGFLHVVVMNPGLPRGSAAFEEAILYEHSFGERERWDADYAAFARAKAKLSWSTGVDGHRLQTVMPHLLCTGDTLLWGSVCLDGIVVGVSGAFPWYDELFAGTIAMAVRSLAKEARELDSGQFALALARLAPPHSLAP